MKSLLGAGLSLPPGHIQKSDTTSFRREHSDQLAEWVRIAFMGCLLAALVMAAFWSEDELPVDTALPPVRVVHTPVPELDAPLLSTIRDDSRTSRIQVEPGPFLHLLDKSANIVPAVAKALGIPATPLPIADLREHPERHRGQYLWYRGTLEETPRARGDHPSKGTPIYEARIKTSASEQVLLAFSTPPAEGTKLGDWVRAEGFFMKLRDMNFPVAIDQAPLLVGPELLRSFEDWKPVTRVDPEILSVVRDGHCEESKDTDGSRLCTLVGDAGDSTLPLDQAQTLPLWHLASYSIEHARGLTFDDINTIPRLLSQEQWHDLLFGNTPKGQTFSIIGTVQTARTIEARANPLGITFWTEAWIQIREIQGRVVPIWIPKGLEGWKPGAPALFAGHFYKLTSYDSADNKPHVAPTFVVADLLEYKLPVHPLAHYLNVPVVLFLVSLIVLAIWFARRDRNQALAVERGIIDRRRRHRGVPPVEATPPS